MPIGNTGSSFRLDGVEVVIYPNATFLAEVALFELRAVLHTVRDPLVGFAAGAAFHTFFQRLDEEVRCERLAFDKVRVTHLGEFVDFGTDRRGAHVHELCVVCAPLLTLLTEGRLWPVPSSGDTAELLAFEERLMRTGIALQFVGLGRNGSIGYNEPGTDSQLGFHRARLGEDTRHGLLARFAPDDPPYEAITSGPRTILAADRVVLVAHGAAQAAAVRQMLEGPINSSCPASFLRRHSNALVLLDQAAAAGLRALSGNEFVMGG